jgi:hypothetical protein
MNSHKERETNQMLYAMTPNCDVVAVDISSTDYTYTGTAVVKGLIVADGTVVKVQKTNSDGSTVDFYLPAPGCVSVDGITKIYKTGTDATHIALAVE